MIRIKQLVKKYGNKTVLDTEDLMINTGKLTAIIGPNGSGKSTLLSIISRLSECDTGDVFFDNQSIKKIKANSLAKKLSILKQSNTINLRITVDELVAFGRFPHSKGRLTDEDSLKITQAIAYVGLQEYTDSYIQSLSGGQRQRAFIAMLIAQDTDYVLLDEPLNNLDMHHAVQVMKLLRNLVDELGKTILIVLHDLNFASVYADEMIAMKKGRIVAFGNTEDLMQKAVLEELYEMPLTLKKFENKQYCLHYC